MVLVMVVVVTVCIKNYNLVFWGPRIFQFDVEMNNNIYCILYIIREDYWRPERAASNYLFFKKKNGHTNKHTKKKVRAEKSPNKGLIL